MTGSSPMDQCRLTRPEWMSLLACCDPHELEILWDNVVAKPDFRWVKLPEFGSVMLRSRANGGGPRFNVGDVTVTRCTLMTQDGTSGVAYVVGRDKRRAALAAILDACLQIEPSPFPDLHQAVTAVAHSLTARREASLAKAYATKVDFSMSVEEETSVHG